MSNKYLRLFLPFLGWWPDLTRENMRADLLAGLTGAIVVLPQGVAFATIAGMPPEYGLYAAMVPAVIAALFGSSRQLVSGPTTAASIVLFSTLGAMAEPGTAEYVSLALTLTFMVGVLQLAMGLARLGTLVNFISHSVVVGFTAGAAILIASSQLATFVGMDMPRGLHLYDKFVYLADHFLEVDPWTTLVGVITVGGALLARRLFPSFPYMISAMLIGGVAAGVLNVVLPPVDGALPIAVVGELPGTLPPFSSPDFSFATIQQLAPAALAVTLFALTEAVSIARALAARSGQHIDGNQEFVGQGLSNLLGSFFSSYVATGSFNRSGVNYEAGARTPLAAILAGVLLMVIVIVVAPALAYLPTAAMAGILFLVAWGIVDFHHMAKISKASRADSSVLWGTFIATLFLELDFAIILGVFLSLVTYLHRASRPRVLLRVPDPRLPKRRFTTDPSLPDCPQMALVRIDGALFFGAVNYVAERLRVIARRRPEQKHLLVLARTISFVDVAGAEMLMREVRLRRAAGGDMYFHQLQEGVIDILRRGGYLAEIGEDVLFETKGEAIAAVFDRLDRGICVRCERRIFNECRTLPRVEVEIDEPEEIILEGAD